ncbi:MAG: hypothetical protein U0K19_00770, partial [Bifidobacteriaceae bacterium]|nr:hypothetical protein [Bifidobacteriaceae bacterium]
AVSYSAMFMSPLYFGAGFFIGKPDLSAEPGGNTDVNSFRQDCRLIPEADTIASHEERRVDGIRNRETGLQNLDHLGCSSVQLVSRLTVGLIVGTPECCFQFAVPPKTFYDCFRLAWCWVVCDRVKA